jgi:hypothetical protein
LNGLRKHPNFSGKRKIKKVSKINDIFGINGGRKTPPLNPLFFMVILGVVLPSVLVLLLVLVLLAFYTVETANLYVDESLAFAATTQPRETVYGSEGKEIMPLKEVKLNAVYEEHSYDPKTGYCMRCGTHQEYAEYYLQLCVSNEDVVAISHIRARERAAEKERETAEKFKPVTDVLTEMQKLPAPERERYFAAWIKLKKEEAEARERAAAARASASDPIEGLDH